MLFKQLVLKNFKSHENTTIDFNHGITVIVGENGAGKSTIFEAISYALFKKSTASQDDLVRSNKNSERKVTLSVELTFEENGVEYKIIREKTPSKTKSTLYQKDDDAGKFTVITAGNSSVDSELKSIIKLDSDLFLNAIYIRQGEIADLVSKTPAKRKELITKLLKIEELEKAWSNIPQLINKYENKQAEFKGESAGYDNAYHELKDSELKLFDFKNKLEESLSDKDSLEKGKNDIELIKKALDEKKSQYDLLTQSLENEEKNLSKMYESKEDLFSQYSTILQQEKDMELLKPYVVKLPVYQDFKNSFIEYNSLKKDLNGVNETISKIESYEKVLIDEKENYENFNKLDSEINVLNTKRSDINGQLKLLGNIGIEKEKSEEKIKSFNDQLNDFSNKVADALIQFDEDFLSNHELNQFIAPLTDDDLSLIDSDEKFDKLKDIIGKLRFALRESIDSNNDKINKLNSEINLLKEGIKSSKKPLSEIKEVGNKCPICQSDISDDKKQELILSYENTIKENTEKIDSNKKDIDELNLLLKELNLKNSSLEELEKSIFSNKHLLTSIKEENLKINDLNKKLENQSQLQNQLTQLDEMIAEKTKTLESLKANYQKYIDSQAALKALPPKDKLKDELYKITGKINIEDEKIKNYISLDSNLSFDIDLDDLNREIKDLEEKSERYHSLSGSVKIKDDLKNRLDDLKNNIESKKEQILEIKRNIKSFEYDPQEYHNVELSLNRILEKINKNTENIGILRGQIASLEPRIIEIKEYLKYVDEIKAELRNLEEYIILLNDFRFCYSKNGVQKELASKARPVIQANTKMFFEKFNFNYSDLLINEDYSVSIFGPEGEANINMVSGGEKIAIALALRLGITQAIAKGNIDSILLDEPTIHLDTQRINELSNLLQNMHIIPQMILVTHDSGLESSADTLIKVTKTDGVSKIEIDE